MSDGDDGTPTNGPRVVDLAQPNKVKGQMDAIRRDLPTLLDNVDLVAKIRRANYEALLREGFNEAQALDLCWK